MLPKSFSRVSSRLIRLYRYESSLGESTRGVDILLIEDSLDEEAKEAVVDLKDGVDGVSP